jgi:hypothetical protein
MTGNSASAATWAGEALAMLDAVLQDRHARPGTGEPGQPGGHALGVIGLGGDEHPVHRPSLGRRAQDLRTGFDDAVGRLDPQMIEGRANTDCNGVLLRETRRHGRADRAGAYEGDAGHGR